MTETFKIVIPTAGWGTRMRPHTLSKPKPLVSVAGKTALEHLMDMFKTMPNPENLEYVFIVGPFLGELQLPAFIKEKYPQIKAHFVVQHEMKGQSHALWLAREYLHGPMQMVFSDTLIETDFSFLAHEKADSVAWVMPVPDPRRFGVAEVGKDGYVTRFIEKPQTMENNLVIAGCYYFKEGRDLVAAIEEQFNRKVTLKNEFFLADAMTIMIERGTKIRVHEINTWLDTGTIEATLDTNKVLLDKMGGNTGKQVDTYTSRHVQVIEPSFIDPSAEISNSTIGPHASIGADCKIENSTITESIVEAGSEIKDAALSRSMVGRQAQVRGRGDGHVVQLNVGDNSYVILS
ncbi:MAG TPA: sugar phosphate nucleotidyltransferase [Anaerolineales bacterium]|nr:sugar phosphate nucleotidyltransferase [Anaerolineales bacterium]HQX15058.1 sugar phosphate nucleotidyltransferase [Anaerolineales bacterium]